MDGRELAARRSDALDRAVRALFGPVQRPGLAVAAVGGYGRRELAPGSDLDLLFLHDGDAERAVEAVRTVAYALWDAGFTVAHSVRTPDQCRQEAAASLETETALLSVRHLAGDGTLVEAVRSATIERAQSDRAGLAARLAVSRTERAARFGVLAHSSQPDLKESLGGSRDAQLLDWLTVTGAGLAGGGDGSFLLLARTALHRVAGSSGNRLAFEHHEAVADLLGIEGAAGWSPRDRLMRQIAEAGRRIAGAAEIALHPEAIHLTDRSPAGTRGLVELLAQGERAEPVLEAMEADGSLVRLIPEWDDVVGRPQRDPYHRYPVDVHLIRTAGEAARLLSAPDEPFVAEAVKLLDDPAPLLLGALLHDVGKVGAGSHVIAGPQIASRILDRLEAEADLREHVLFLVREHLLLSDTATRRNLEDEDLVLHVAARVGSPQRLASLFLLTVADGLATGPGAASPWRMALVRELVGKAGRAFERGLMDRSRAHRLADAEAAVRAALSDERAERVEAFVGSVPPAYLLRADPAVVTEHLSLVVPAPGPEEARIHVAPGRSAETSALSVGARDRLGLLASIAGALTLSGLSILSAEAFTTENGIALDLFEVAGAFEHQVDETRWGRFQGFLTDALEGRVDLDERVRSLRQHYRPPKADVPVEVRLHGESGVFTVAEVEAADRLGLLFDLSRAIAALGVDVHSAKVATYGHRVVDVFYVTDRDGRAVTHGDPGSALRAALIEAAGGGA